MLGHLIGAALVGTFAGIFFSYAVVSPIATKIKIVREKKMRLYIIVKQTLLAFMNGAMPQVALEHGRKTISAYERPTIDEVEQETLDPGGGGRSRNCTQRGGMTAMTGTEHTSTTAARQSLAELFNGALGPVERLPLLQAVLEQVGPACAEGIGAISRHSGAHDAAGHRKHEHRRRLPVLGGRRRDRGAPGKRLEQSRPRRRAA